MAFTARFYDWALARPALACTILYASVLDTCILKHYYI